MLQPHPEPATGHVRLAGATPEHLEAVLEARLPEGLPQGFDALSF